MTRGKQSVLSLLIGYATLCEASCVRVGARSPADTAHNGAGRDANGGLDRESADDGRVTVNDTVVQGPDRSPPDRGLDGSPSDQAAGSTTCYSTAMDNDQDLLLLRLDMITATHTVERRVFLHRSGHVQAGLARFRGAYVGSFYDGSDHRRYQLRPGGALELGVATQSGAVAVLGGQLVAPCVSGLCRYDTFQMLAEGRVNGTISGPSGFAVMAIADDDIYGGHHADDRLSVHDAVTGASRGELLLEGFDDWIEGLSVVGDTVYLLDASRFNHFDVLMFDRQTGKRTRSLPFKLGKLFEVAGLWCE